MTTISELTKQEIRTLEGKLIKHFSQQLATKARLSRHGIDTKEVDRYPSLSHWLKVVGITKESADILESRYRSLDALMPVNPSELNRLLLTVKHTLNIVILNRDVTKELFYLSIVCVFISRQKFCCFK